MSSDFPLIPDKRHIPTVTRGNAPDASATVLSTRDPEVIRDWARRVGGEPATGEATASGSATALKVEDLGTGLRFNFPGASLFRSISWDEWLDHFASHDLTFVFENTPPNKPPNARYRIVPTAMLTNV